MRLLSMLAKDMAALPDRTNVARGCRVGRSVAAGHANVASRRYDCSLGFVSQSLVQSLPGNGELTVLWLVYATWIRRTIARLSFDFPACDRYRRRVQFQRHADADSFVRIIADREPVSVYQVGFQKSDACKVGQISADAFPVPSGSRIFCLILDAAVGFLHLSDGGIYRARMHWISCLGGSQCQHTAQKNCGFGRKFNFHKDIPLIILPD